MGDVARILAEHSPASLQSLMHDRLTIETCENIHLHWRSLRIEMSITDAARLLDVCWRFGNLIPLLQGRVLEIPLDAICPYDERHRRVGEHGFDNGSPEETAEHEAGIKWMIEQMKSGRRPWPIAIRPGWGARFSRPEDRRSGNVWQRLDGFKRYMAHKALDLPTIKCFLVAGDRPGCQHGHCAFQEDGEKLPSGFTTDFFMDATPQRLSVVESEKQRCCVNQVELLKNDTIHVHLGDTRLEFNRDEFVAFANMIRNAHISL
jgi:hypothetical protein